MEKEFVPVELALRMKAIGFDEPCFGHYQQEYHDDGMTELEPSLQMIISKQHQHAYQVCTAPLYQQAFKWFRKNYRLSVNIHDCLDDFEAIITQWALSDHKVVHEFPQRVDISYPHNRFDSYEEAELSCLVRLIEIVK